MEEGLHAGAEGLVVAVHASPDGGFASHAGAADSGEDRADDLVTEGKQGSDGAGGLRGDAVAPRAAWLDDEVLPAELAQVVSGLADRVAGLAGHGADPGGVLGDGEAVRRGVQGQCRREGGADPRLVQVDAADPGSAEPGGQRQLVEGAVGEEADVGAVQGGGEPAGHAGEAGDDLGEVVQAAAAAQLFGVVHGGLEAQDVFALSVKPGPVKARPVKAGPPDSWGDWFCPVSSELTICVLVGLGSRGSAK